VIAPVTATPLSVPVKVPDVPGVTAVSSKKPARAAGPPINVTNDVGRGQEGSHFRGPRRASYRAAKSELIAGTRTTARSQRSNAALCGSKLRSGTLRSR
jgi:hypothetical protein